MKKALLLLLCVPLVFSCQKGEDDPAISLRTRKSRLTGDWKVVYYQAEQNGMTTLYEGEKITYRQGDTFELSIPFTWTVSFDSEGDYHFEKTEEYPADPENGIAAAYTATSEEKGIWEFTGGNGTPAKSQLLLLAQEIKYMRSDQGSNIEIMTVDHPHQGFVYDMKELSNKDLVITYDEVTSTAFGQTVNRAEIKLKKQR